MKKLLLLLALCLPAFATPVNYDTVNCHALRVTRTKGTQPGTAKFDALGQMWSASRDTADTVMHLPDSINCKELYIKTNGTGALFSTYRNPTNSDGYNIWIGGGGYSVIGNPGYTLFGSYNTALGYGALFSDNSGFENTAVGYCALHANTGDWTGGAYNTAIGTNALSTNTTGNYNDAHGWQALYLNTTGSQNAALGTNSLNGNTQGNYNTAVGTSSLGNNTTGSFNTAIGWQAGENGGVPLNTMSYCTFLGASALATIDGIVNSTAIGYGAQVTASNQMVYGNASVAAHVFPHGTVTISNLTAAGILGNTAVGLVLSFTGVDSGAGKSGYLTRWTDTHKLDTVNVSQTGNLLTLTDSEFVNGYGIYTTHGIKTGTLSLLDTVCGAKGFCVPIITFPGTNNDNYIHANGNYLELYGHSGIKFKNLNSNKFLRAGTDNVIYDGTLSSEGTYAANNGWFYDTGSIKATVGIYGDTMYARAISAAGINVYSGISYLSSLYCGLINDTLSVSNSNLAMVHLRNKGTNTGPYISFEFPNSTLEASSPDSGWYVGTTNADKTFKITLRRGATLQTPFSIDTARNIAIAGTLCGLTAGQIGMGSTTGLTPSAITQDASNVVITGRNVGINCTPLTKFHVKVTTDENFKIQGHDALTDGVALVSGNDVANAYKSMEFAASQFDFVNGEVGINCTPTRKLTVSGGALVDSLVATQSFTISGVQTAAAPGTLTPTCSRIKVTGGAGTYTLAAGTLPEGTMIFIYEDNGNTGVIIAGNYHSITLNTDTGVWAVRNATGWSLQMPAL
jgi:hypothetical protein